MTEQIDGCVVLPELVLKVRHQLVNVCTQWTTQVGGSVVLPEPAFYHISYILSGSGSG